MGNNYFAFASADGAGAGVQCPTAGTATPKQHRQATGSQDRSARKAFLWRFQMDRFGMSCNLPGAQLPAARSPSQALHMAETCRQGWGSHVSQGE